MRIGYVNTIGGASGDMLIASLIDSGLSIDDLKSQLNLLDVGGFDHFYFFYLEEQGLEAVVIQQ